jgi:membrane-associated phospholipid phosphatase
VSRRQLLAVAFLSCAGYLWLALLTSDARVFPIEQSTRAAVSLARQPILDLPMRTVSLLGDEWGLVPLILIGSGALWTRRRRWAGALPLIMIGTAALQWLAKWMVDRPRPNLAPLGFPSGHVLSLVVLFGLAAYVLCRVRSDRAARCLGVSTAAALISLVAVSRLYLEAHWFLDVVGGFLLGLTYLMLLIWTVETLSARATEPVTVAVPSS